MVFEPFFSPFHNKIHELFSFLVKISPAGPWDCLQFLSKNSDFLVGKTPHTPYFFLFMNLFSTLQPQIDHDRSLVKIFLCVSLSAWGQKRQKLTCVPDQNQTYLFFLLVFLVNRDPNPSCCFLHCCCFVALLSSRTLTMQRHQNDVKNNQISWRRWKHQRRLHQKDVKNQRNESNSCGECFFPFYSDTTFPPCADRKQMPSPGQSLRCKKITVFAHVLKSID